MADDPADVDPAEWAAAAPTEISEPNTAPHHVALAQSADFLAGLEVGRAEGHHKGYIEGRADQRAQDRDDALDDFEAALRLFLFEAGIEHGDHFAADVRRRVKRT